MVQENLSELKKVLDLVLAPGASVNIGKGSTWRTASHPFGSNPRIDSGEKDAAYSLIIPIVVDNDGLQ